MWEGKKILPSVTKNPEQNGRLTIKRTLNELKFSWATSNGKILKSIGVWPLKEPEPSLPIISDLLACNWDLLAIFIIVFGDLLACSSDLSIFSIGRVEPTEFTLTQDNYFWYQVLLMVKLLFFQDHFVVAVEGRQNDPERIRIWPLKEPTIVI